MPSFRKAGPRLQSAWPSLENRPRHSWSAGAFPCGVEKDDCREENRCGVVASHDGAGPATWGDVFAGRKKELEKLSEGRFTPHVPHPAAGSDAQLKRFSALESDSKLFSDSSPAIDELRKGLPPFFGWPCGRPSRWAECSWACE